jgi:hypothetical protein
VQVTTRYYQAVQKGAVQAFIIDMQQAHLAAGLNHDRQGQTALLRLWLEHFDGLLGTMTAPKLIEYLEARQVWRQEADWVVFKTIDEPCIAYTAQKSPEGSVTLIALAGCYRFPNGRESDWWNDAVLPRVRSL